MQVITAEKRERDFMTTWLKTFVISLLLLVGCRSQTGDFVPNVLVDVFINMNLPSYQQLNLVGGTLFFNEAGYRGLIVHRLALDEFRAYDRACTFQPSESCHVVELDTATNLLECPCCNSRFSLDGFPARGPAGINLRQYRTLYSSSSNTLRITN
jgi:Rieske Fe-S protein